MTAATVPHVADMVVRDWYGAEVTCRPHMWADHRMVLHTVGGVELTVDDAVALRDWLTGWIDHVSAPMLPAVLPSLVERGDGGAGEAPIVSPAPTPSPDAQALAGWIVDHAPVVDRMTAVAVEDDPRLLVAPAVAVGVPVPVSPEVHREVVGLLREAARRG